MIDSNECQMLVELFLFISFQKALMHILFHTHVSFFLDKSYTYIHATSILFILNGKLCISLYKIVEVVLYVETSETMTKKENGPPLA